MDRTQIDAFDHSFSRPLSGRDFIGKRVSVWIKSQAPDSFSILRLVLVLAPESCVLIESTNMKGDENNNYRRISDASWWHVTSIFSYCVLITMKKQLPKVKPIKIHCAAYSLDMDLKTLKLRTKGSIIVLEQWSRTPLMMKREMLYPSCKSVSMSSEDSFTVLEQTTFIKNNTYWTSRIGFTPSTDSQ